MQPQITRAWGAGVEYGGRDDGDGAPPAGDGVLPPQEELVRALARYGAELVGPPPTLADLGLPSI
jgi:hypothetical protein